MNDLQILQNVNFVNFWCAIRETPPGMDLVTAKKFKINQGH